MHLTRINVLRNTLTGLTLLIVIANASADQGIGFVAGPTYGYGIGYNRYLNNGYGWQISGFPYVEEGNRNLNLGLTVFKILHEGKSGRPFLSLGASIHHQWEQVFTINMRNGRKCHIGKTCPYQILNQVNV